MLDDLAASRDRVVFGGQRMRVPWHPGIVQIPVTDPTPVYPWSMLWRRGNPHPALPRLIDHIAAHYRPYEPEAQWLPRRHRSHTETPSQLTTRRQRGIQAATVANNPVEAPPGNR